MRHYKLTASVPRLVAPLVMASPAGTSPSLVHVNVGNPTASAPASVNQYGSNDALAAQMSLMAGSMMSMQSGIDNLCGLMRASLAPAPAATPVSAPAPAPAPAPAQVEVAPVQPVIVALATPVDASAAPAPAVSVPAASPASGPRASTGEKRERVETPEEKEERKRRANAEATARSRQNTALCFEKLAAMQETIDDMEATLDKLIKRVNKHNQVLIANGLIPSRSAAPSAAAPVAASIAEYVPRPILIAHPLASHQLTSSVMAAVESSPSFAHYHAREDQDGEHDMPRTYVNLSSIELPVKPYRHSSVWQSQQKFESESRLGLMSKRLAVPSTAGDASQCEQTFYDILNSPAKIPASPYLTASIWVKGGLAQVKTWFTSTKVMNRLAHVLNGNLLPTQQPERSNEPGPIGVAVWYTNVYTTMPSSSQCEQNFQSWASAMDLEVHRLSERGAFGPSVIDPVRPATRAARNRLAHAMNGNTVSFILGDGCPQPEPSIPPAVDEDYWEMSICGGPGYVHWGYWDHQYYLLSPSEKGRPLNPPEGGTPNEHEQVSSGRDALFYKPITLRALSSAIRKNNKARKTIAWAVSAKRRNRLMHAANGNPSSSLVGKIHLDGAPLLTTKDADLKQFLLWTIDLHAYCTITGMTEWIIGPESSKPADGTQELQDWQKKRETALRYLCAMITDPDLSSSVALNGKRSGYEGYSYLKKEFLQGQSVQSRYLSMLQALRLERSDSVVVFRNLWQKVVSQLDPVPADNILSEYFAHSVTANTGNFYDACLDQDISRDDYMEYTRKLTKLCQARKDRIDSKVAKEKADGKASAHSSQLEKELKETRNALKAAQKKLAAPSPDKGRNRDPDANAAGRDGGKGGKLQPCKRCGKNHEGGIKACKAPKISCPFKYPDGSTCGGDHLMRFCWAKNPELCPLPKVRQSIERRLGKKPSANKAWADSDSEEENDDAEGHMCYKIVCRPCKPLRDETEGIIDVPASALQSEPYCHINGETGGVLHVDTGASDHIIMDGRCILQPELHTHDVRIRVRTGNRTTAVTSVGPATFIVRDQNNQMVTITRKVLYIKRGFDVNLFSVPLDYDYYGTSTRFDPHNSLCLGDGTTIPFMRETRRYLLPYEVPATPAHSAKIIESSESNSLSSLWHRRMGHCSAAVLEHLPLCLTGVELEPKQRKFLEQIPKLCLICPMAKLKESPHPVNKYDMEATKELMREQGFGKVGKVHRNKQYHEFGGRVLMDLAGPLTPSLHKAWRYVSLFVDDGTDMIFVYFLHEKQDQKDQHLVFRSDTAEYGDVKLYHSDNGGEYRDKEYLKQILVEGAARTFSVPYTPNHNGKAENTFWRLFCVARALLFESGMPQCHWPYAVQHAAYLLNRTPMKRMEQGQSVWKTPYERLKARQPHTRHIRVWGCQVSAGKPKHLRNQETDPKLAPRAELAYYMGRSPDKKAFIVFIPAPGAPSLTVGSYRERRTLTFYEEVTPRRIKNKMVQGFPLVLHKEPRQQPNTPDEDEEEPEEAAAPTPASTSDPCRHPGCTFRFGHDGAHSNEITPGSARPSANLRPRRPRGLIAGVGGLDSLELQSGTKLIWANNQCSFDFTGSMFRTNILDAEDMALAINQEDAVEVHALVAKQKMFRNEGDGSYQTKMVPKTLKEVLQSSEQDKHKWVEAMIEELQSHLTTGTWVLVSAESIPAKRRRVGSTWVFDIKRDANGKIIRYKARLCAQGFTQEEGVDYFHTYSNTIRYETLRLLLALAALYDLSLTSIDIKTAYLNGYVESEIDIYMSPPRGFKFTATSNHGAGKAEFSNTFEFDKEYACLLKRSIYGLKQSGRCWETRFWERIKELGGVQSPIDPCLWKVQRGAEFILVGIYVDDVVFASNAADFRDAFVADLTKSFKVVDQGPLAWIFGTAIRQNVTTGTVQLSQSLYIEDLAHRYQPPTNKGRIIPCPPDIVDLVPGKEDEMLHPQYRAIIGQLLWVSMISRPDIAYAVSFLSRFCTSGTETHFKAAVGVVGYLFATKDKVITYRREGSLNLREHILAHSELKEYIFGKNTILTFTDASHGGERPMAGYVGMLADGPVSWAAYRLPLTPLSVCQGEYHAATRAAVMSKAYCDCIKFLGFEVQGAAPIFCDNRATILLSDAGISVKKLRHVATHIAFLRELVNSEDIMLLHIGTKGQIADICTKPLAAAIFHALRVFLL